MALTDISRVTDSLTTLLTQVLARDTNTATLDISAAPPDDDSSTLSNVISLYLFHVAEDPHSRNWTKDISATSPVQQTEMGLVLYYVVTARSTAEEFGASARSLIEQRLLGFVARAFHDFPIIDDHTIVPPPPPAPLNPPVPVLESANLHGAGNQIQIILRPVGVEETINFWSTEQNEVPRLSLFYEVRLVNLATPPEEGSAPPVLSVADFVQVGPRLVLLRALSRLGFALPVGHPLADPASPFRFITANPARVALFPAGAVPQAVPPENNRVTLEGAGFQSDRTRVALEGPVGIGPAEPENRWITIDLDDPANLEWSISHDGSRIILGFRETLTDVNATAFTIYPGIYRARVIIGTQISDIPEPRFLEQSSADVAFAVAPQILDLVAGAGPANARQFTLNLFGTYLRNQLDVQVNVAGQALRRDANPTVAGNFSFVENTGVISFAVDTMALHSPLSVQLIINGAEAAPAWAVIP